MSPKPHRCCARPMTYRARSPTKALSRRQMRATCAACPHGNTTPGRRKTDPAMARTRTESMDRIGFLGLGTMGGPMARNILRKGYPVKGFDLSRAAVEAHVAAGGQAAASLADLAN